MFWLRGKPRWVKRRRRRGKGNGEFWDTSSGERWRFDRSYLEKHDS
jgi:hypothetical protein